MRQQAQHHLCTLCGKEPVGDLILYKRKRNPYGKPISAREMVRHLYLCESHYKDMLEFLSSYTGEDEYIE